MSITQLEIDVLGEPINANYDFTCSAIGFPSDITNYNWSVTNGYILSHEINEVTIRPDVCRGRPKLLIVSVLAANTCGSVSTNKTVLHDCDGWIINPLSVKPNPVNDYLEAFLDDKEYTGEENLHIKLYNNKAIQVYNGVTKSNSFKISTNSFPEGVYYLVVQYKDQKYTKMILISH